MIPGFQGIIPGFQGTIPGFQGIIPGFQGTIPSFQGTIPSFQGTIPGFHGAIPVFFASHSINVQETLCFCVTKKKVFSSQRIRIYKYCIEKKQRQYDDINQFNCYKECQTKRYPFPFIWVL